MRARRRGLFELAHHRVRFAAASLTVSKASSSRSTNKHTSHNEWHTRDTRHTPSKERIDQRSCRPSIDVRIRTLFTKRFVKRKRVFVNERRQIDLDLWLAHDQLSAHMRRLDDIAIACTTFAVAQRTLANHNANLLRQRGGVALAFACIDGRLRSNNAR